MYGSGLFFGCFEATVRATGEVIIVRKSRPFHIEETPTYEQIGNDGTVLREFEYYELAF